MEVKEEY